MSAGAGANCRGFVILKKCLGQSTRHIRTHLAWRFDHGALRQRQVRALDALARDWARDADFPPIVVGDLNADPDADEIRYLCGLTALDGHSTYYQDAWRVGGEGPGFTWDNRNPFTAMMFEPDRRLDYILVGLADLNGRGWIERVALACDQPADGVWAGRRHVRYSAVM
jgi:endonuclease/exonuclease/phosphatase family metal-dependent hydrolase